MKVLGLAVLGAASALPVSAAEFRIFEQGAKAMGMAGAFTAQADDPSLLFHNVGGLAFVEERQFSVGVTWIHGAKAEFEGPTPSPGEGYTAEQEKPVGGPAASLLHAAVQRHHQGRLRRDDPVRPDHLLEEPRPVRRPLPQHRGGADAPSICQPDHRLAGHADNFGIGLGGIARVSTVELNRNVPADQPLHAAGGRRRPAGPGEPTPSERLRL